MMNAKLIGGLIMAFIAPFVAKEIASLNAEYGIVIDQTELIEYITQGVMYCVSYFMAYIGHSQALNTEVPKKEEPINPA